MNAMKRIPRLQVITDEVLQTRFTHLELARLARWRGNFKLNNVRSLTFASCR